MRELPLPMDIVDCIYSYIDLFNEIKKEKLFRFKRLISDDFYYNMVDFPVRKYVFKQEERMFEILMKNKAYNLIKNIHAKNLKKDQEENKEKKLKK